MATFVSDTFTGSDGTQLTSHTGEAGATWTLATGGADKLALASNRLSCAGTGYSEALAYASGAPATAEYDVQFVYRINTSVPADSYDGVEGRYQTSGGNNYLVSYETFFGRWKLSRNGTSLGTYTQTLTPGTDYTVKLEIRDAAKKVFIDGTERISSADNTVTAAGKVAVRTYGTNSLNITIDTLTATDAGGAAAASDPPYRPTLPLSLLAM